MTSPVVTRLLISSPSSTSLSSMKVRSSSAATEPASMTPRRSSSEPASVPENAARFRAKVADRALLGHLAAEHHVAVADQRRRDVEVRVGVLDEGVAGVDDLPEVLAGPGERLAELVDGRLERLLVDRLHRLGEVGQQGLGLDRGPGVLDRRSRCRPRGRAARRSAAAARRTARRRPTGCRPARSRRRGWRRSPRRCRAGRRRPRRSAPCSPPARPSRRGRSPRRRRRCRRTRRSGRPPCRCRRGRPGRGARSARRRS